jgi:transposase InsO family protein
MCWLGQVSRTGYYRHWCKVEPVSEEISVREQIHALVFAHRAYGYRRVTAALRQRGWAMNHKRVARLMRLDGLQAMPPKRWTKTTHSQHSCAVFPNRLRHLQASGPDQIWVSDLTYLRTPKGFVYLAVVLDAWSRRVIGWELGDSLNSDLTCAALEQAIAERQPEPALVHHSDRGVQYASQQYVRLLSRHRMIGSMSRFGNPYDNARCESFFKTLKTEQGCDRLIADSAEWRERLRDYIEYYNRQRLHSALAYQTPLAFETQLHGSEAGAHADEFFQA